MAMNSIEFVTSFESMSNELFMEIFEYYDLYSLFYSFGSLNSRIDHILNHCQVSVDFDQVKRSDFDDFTGHVLPKFNAKNIRSLNISNSYQIGVFSYAEFLLDFTHIRSLSVKNIHSDLLEHLFSVIHFSRLERFIFGKCKGEYRKKCLIFKYLLNSNQYPSLRTYKDSCNVIRDVTYVSSIEYVTFYRASLVPQFFNFLHHSPCLKYIKAPLYFRAGYSETVFLSPIHQHNTLTHLNVDLLGEVCTKTTVYLFQCLPRLYRLKLNVQSTENPELTDPLFWERVFSKYSTELKQLSLNAVITNRYHLDNSPWNPVGKEEKVIEQIPKSNYWSSHQWKATFKSIVTIPQFVWAEFKVVSFPY